MELRHLKTFCVAAEVQSFTETARRLDYVQSNITNQIKQLEDELNVKLFDRLGKKVVLSNEGRAFYPYAQNILKQCEEAHNVLSADPFKGVLNIGASDTCCIYYLPQLLKEYRRRYPLVEVKVDTVPCYRAPDMLRANKVDIAVILSNTSSNPDITSKLLSRERMFVVTSPHHRLAQAEAPIEPQRLSRECLILTSPTCGYRPIVLSILQELEVQPESVIELANVAAIKECLYCGLGFAVLPEKAVRSELDSGALRSLSVKQFSLEVQNQLIYHKDKWMSSISQAFVDLCVSQKLNADQ